MEGSEQWQRIKEIVAAALDHPAEQRASLLDRECAGDPSLRAEVESLLSAYPTSGKTTLLEGSPEVAKSLGPYHLLQKLGEGGMGHVWLAEQTAPVRRKVALKVVRTGLYDDSVIRRFHAERQLLAIMDHPAIAKIFDAGTTPDGQPYFVMDFVPGAAITDYCDRQKLTIRERLALFSRACEGVQHAHQKGIIHRDLKPANILVMEIDGKPVPRIIDFGLAKPLTPYLSGETLHTKIGGFVGTPGYMSPEQADPALLDVDTRTDVYSLGVILYELLTGALPFDTTQWKKQRLEEILRHLREDDPLRPSTKVSSNREGSTSWADARSTQPGTLVSILRGDLDWITIKALDKNRDRRYGGVSELTADISRYLNHEPVLARPASAGYRLGKYVRRHRIGVALGATMVLLVSGFSVVQAVELKRITRERDRGDRIAEFMRNMFKVSNPSESRGNTITAREILDKASKDVDAGLAQDPEMRASMMDLLGRVYNNLGLYARAQELLTPAVEIRKSVLGSKDPETLSSMINLGISFAEQGKFDDSRKLYQQVIDTARVVGARAQRQRISAMNNLALDMATQRHIADAEKLQREVIDLRRQLDGPEHPDTLTAISNLALFLRREGHFADAEKLDRQVLADRRRILGSDAPDTLRSAANLAHDLWQEQQHDAEAEQLLRQTIEAQRRVVGPEHPDTLVSLNALGNVLDQEGKLADAETIKREVMEIAMRTLGPENPRTLDYRTNVAVSLERQGKYAEAAQQFREIFEIQRRLRGPENYNTLLVMTNLAAALQDSRQFREAEKLGREALEIERRSLGDENPVTVEQMSNLANVLKQLKQDSDAEKLLREARDHQAHVFGPDHPKTALSTYILGAWAAANGDRDRAFALLSSAIQHGLDVATLQGVEKDADLQSLHQDPRWSALAADARQHAAATGKNQ